MQHKDIANRLKILRKELKMSQTDFGRKIGKNYHSVMRWELGRVLPPENVIDYICDCFGVSPEWLRNGSGDIFTTTPAENTAEEPMAEYDARSNNLIPYYKTCDKIDYTADEMIALPDVGIGFIAVCTPKGSTPPLAAGDIAVIQKSKSADTDGFYLIRDSYSDHFIRWFSKGEAVFTSKQAGFPDTPLGEAKIIGRVYKTYRQIELY
jgi:transcriptional regulator with XRE-family HTH domain